MKGKYAARAANRIEAADREATEDAYRRRVLKLTEERDAARAERDKARTDLAKETRILRAQLAEGTSPKVEALTRELNRIREERDELGRWKKESREKYGAAFRRFTDHFIAGHQLSPKDAVEAAWRLYAGAGSETLVVDNGVEKKLVERFGADAVRAIRKARGESEHLSGNGEIVRGPTS